MEYSASENWHQWIVKSSELVILSGQRGEGGTDGLEEEEGESSAGNLTWQRVINLLIRLCDIRKAKSDPPLPPPPPNYVNKISTIFGVHWFRRQYSTIPSGSPFIYFSPVFNDLSAVSRHAYIIIFYYDTPRIIVQNFIHIYFLKKPRLFPLRRTSDRPHLQREVREDSVQRTNYKNKKCTEIHFKSIKNNITITVSKILGLNIYLEIILGLQLHFLNFPLKHTHS